LLIIVLYSKQALDNLDKLCRIDPAILREAAMPQFRDLLKKLKRLFSVVSLVSPPARESGLVEIYSGSFHKAGLSPELAVLRCIWM
jgi:hypothetical protein